MCLFIVLNIIINVAFLQSDHTVIINSWKRKSYSKGLY